MDYRHHSHSVYLMTYHLVFVTKYRKPFITDEIGDFMKEHSAYLCERLGCKLVSAETDRDHMHLLISAPPSVRPSDFVRVIKTQLSKELHIRYSDEIGEYIYGKAPYFSPSYFVATTGTTSLKKVEEYINSQKTDDHKRKYVKSNKYAKKKKWAE